MSFTHQLERLGIPASVESQADRWERKHGSEEAVRLIRERIAQADRAARRHLYRLHDEISRRVANGDIASA